MNRSIPAVVALSAALFAPAAAFAGEKVFGYTQNSDVLAEGASEAELWNTYFDTGVEPTKSSGLKSRLELETGVGGDTQIAAYLNFESTQEETAPGTFETKGEFSGASLEVKTKLSDASADPLGFALYFEPSLSADEFEFEMKAIADKRIGDHYLAGNFTYEPRFVRGDAGKWGKLEGNVEIAAGYGYWVTQRVLVGVEVRDNNWLADGKWQNSALSIGPTVHARVGKFWATLAVQPQVAALRGATDHGLVLEGDGQNRIEVRLLTGINF